MIKRLCALMCLLALLLLPACSSDDPAGGNTATSAAVATTEDTRGVTTTEGTAEDGDQSGASTTSSAPPEVQDTDEAAEGAVPDLDLFHNQPGLELIEVMTPASGGGDRPLLEWAPVEGAHHYSVSLFDSDGDLYWGWTGFGTSVHVGGDPQLVDLAPGPRVVEGMTWGVGAYGEDFVPIATSALLPVGP
jgi:hypothetical protein